MFQFLFNEVVFSFVFRATIKWTDGKDFVLMREMLRKDIFYVKRLIGTEETHGKILQIR